MTPIEVGLHSLRIGAATTPAPGGEVPRRVIQRQGRWKSPESSKVYTRNNPEDASNVSCKLAETGKTGKGSQVRVMYGAEPRSVDTTSEVEYVKGLLPLRSPSFETACVRAPTGGLGRGELLGTGIMIGNEKQRLVPRFSYHASRAPPQRRRG